MFLSSIESLVPTELQRITVIFRCFYIVRIAPLPLFPPPWTDYYIGDGGGFDELEDPFFFAWRLVHVTSRSYLNLRDVFSIVPFIKVDLLSWKKKLGLQ